MPYRFKPTYTLPQFAELIGRSPAVTRGLLRDLGFLAAGKQGRQAISTAELREQCPALLASIAMVYNGRELRELAERAWAEVDAPRGVRRIGGTGRVPAARRAPGEARERGAASPLESLERAIATAAASMLERIRAGHEADEAASAKALAQQFGAPEDTLLARLRQATRPARELAAHLRDYEIESPFEEADATPLLGRMGAVA